MFTCGGLMTGLVPEIEKIAAYAKGGAVTQADIDAVADPVLSAEVFKLSDAVLQGRYNQAASILGDLLKMQTEPIMILAALGSQLRRIWTARLALDSGRDRYWLMELWGMKSDYPAKLLLSAARRTTGVWCAQAVRHCQELDRRMKETHPDPRVAIIDGENRVHMAHMDIHYGYSVNGVAALHTEILKKAELKAFYDLYPDKFNNKTNGVTLRRWLEVCNPQLASLLDECVGRGWRRDPDQLNKLMEFAGDSAVLDRMLAIKAEKKRELADVFAREQGITLDPESVFDIQVKRLHEYKRQQMNALYVIHKYLEIKGGKTPQRPVTVLFGAKAAPAYVMAKHIIHLILCLRKLIESDPQARPWLHVAMVENYNVTWAERVIPACDISEQISLASKEASGTGNMKFMANGAVTLGTLDGANVEIADLVGPDNIYTFGASSNWVIELYDQKARDPKMGYQSAIYYQRPAVKPLVDFLLDPVLTQYGDGDSLKALWTDITGKDWFMSLLDVESYIAARDRAIHDYGDKPFWARKMLVNTARSWFFSSDRTIAQYNRDIWHLK